MNFKKIGKRLMSLLLTLCMVISCVPAPAVLAASEDTSLTGGGVEYTYQQIHEGKLKDPRLMLYPEDTITWSKVGYEDYSENLKIVYKGTDGTGSWEVATETFPNTKTNPAVIRAQEEKEKGKKYNEWQVFQFEKGRDQTILNLRAYPVKPSHSITTSSKGHGTISAASTAEEDSKVELTVAPETGYELDLENTEKTPADLVINEENGKYSFIMPKTDVDIKAVFKETATEHLIDIKGGKATNVSGQKIEKAGKGATVNIAADDLSQNKKVFDRWTGRPEDIALLNGMEEYQACFFTMPDRPVAFTAVHVLGYFIKMNGGSEARIGRWPIKSDDVIKPGTIITIEAPATKEGKAFKTWRVDRGNVTPVEPNKNETTFTMPEGDVEFIPVYEGEETTHKVSIGAGKAFVGGKDVNNQQVAEGTKVDIEPNQPTTFKEWDIISGNVTLDQAVTVAKNSFTMGNADVSINATYKTAHAIKATNDGNATGTSAQPSSATEGTRVLLSAGIPNSGYKFKKWEVQTEGVTLDSETSPSTYFTMPDKEVSVKATFEADLEERDITVTTEGDGTATATPAKAAAGTEITLNAAAKTGSHFKEWQVLSQNIQIDTTAPSAKFTMPGEPVSVKAVFEADDAEHNIKVTCDASQGIASADKNTATAGTLVTLTAEPKTGFRFKEWQVISGGVDIDATNNTFLMPAADVEINAVFEAEQGEAHSITVNNGTTDKEQAKQGETVNITAPANLDGKKFKDWTVNKGGVTLADASKAVTSFTMGDQDVELTANYEDLIPTEYSVTVTNDGHGEATATPAKATPGTAVTLAVSRVDDGYVFKEWQVVKGSVTIANNAFVMPESDVEIKAVFEKKAPVEFKDLKADTPLSMGTLIANEAPGARLFVSYLRADDTLIDGKYEDFPYAVEQYEGISDWLVVEASKTGEECRLVLKEKEKRVFGVTVNSGKAYDIRSQAITEAREGDLVTIEADKAPNGKVFDRWQASDSVNLKDQSAAATEFIMPAKAVEITALYKDAPVAEYTVTVGNDGNGTAKADVTKAKAGDTVKLTATPKDGYVFKEWQIVKGKVVIKNNSFTMPAENVEIKAVFAKKGTPVKPVDPTKPNNGTTTNPVTGLEMSATETSGFALVALSMLLLGITAVYRRKKVK